jgi:serine/threonine-protein kinase
MSLAPAAPVALSCPDAARLKAFHGGRLPVPDLEEIEAHLSSCSACQSALQELDARPREDPLYTRLARCWKSDPLLAEQGCAQLEDAAKALETTTKGMVVKVSPVPKPACLDTAVAKEVGPYQILDVIGKGGMGKVYRAKQRPVNREVALKMILAGPLAGRDAILRFHREGQAIARLNHANIVQLYEFREHDGLPYFSMELIEGESLAARLATGPLPWREAAQLIATLARAVAAAHEQQVVHRDLKPGNILLTRDGVPKITDFGLAKLSDSDDQQTCSEAVLGTPAYMSPEQAAGRIQDIGPAADIYALGVMLYECLTGRPPFRGETKAQTLELVRKADPLAPSRMCRDLPVDLEAACLKALEKTPSKRYATATDFAEDLDCVVHGVPTKVRPPKWPKRLWKTLKRHKAAVALSAVLFGAMFLLFFLDPKRPLRQMEGRLARGESIAPIGPTGWPKHYEFVAGQDKTQLSLHERDQTFCVHTWGLALLRLIADPQHESYCIKAQIRHGESQLPGEVGIFFAHHSRPGSQAPLHLFVQLAYNDIRRDQEILDRSPHKAPPSKGNYARVKPRFYGDEQRYDRPLHFVAPAALFQPATIAKPRWRQLEINVRPDKVWATWDGQAAGELTIAEFLEQLEKDLRFVERNDPDPFVVGFPRFFPARGSLGIYIWRGSASFRDVTVMPVKS